MDRNTLGRGSEGQSKGVDGGTVDSAALVLLALGIYLSLLNQAPTSAYFAHTLAAWEQGRFIRFHGLAQWLGWSWPYAVLVYALTQFWIREPKN